MKSESRKACLRCAVYTRVSTEHGLEQEFNCESIVRTKFAPYGLKSQAVRTMTQLAQRSATSLSPRPSDGDPHHVNKSRASAAAVAASLLVMCTHLTPTALAHVTIGVTRHRHDHLGTPRSRRTPGRKFR